MSDATRLAAGSGERAARADRILDVTAELLLRHGYKRVTIDDVATGAGIGKGTVYLHWRTREALFWAVLQRDTIRMLEPVVADLGREPGLAMPSRLMRTIFLAAMDHPLVLALLLPDSELLGNLAKDRAVADAQQELAGNESYLVLLHDQGLLRPGLSPDAAGYILASVMRGFFNGPDQPSVAERADLLAGVLARSLEPDAPLPERALSALARQVTGLFTAIIAGLRTQLERAYG
jgi:AcrR family transcriptional regulator